MQSPAYGKIYNLVKLYGNIWNDVQLKTVKEKLSIGNQDCALNIIKDGNDGAIQKLSIQMKGKIKENATYKGAIEILTAEKYVCDTTNHGKDMVMLYKAKKTNKIEELTQQNLIKEKMAEQSIYPLWKITLNENLTKKKLSTILTLIKKTILSRTFTCLKTGKNITSAIIVLNKLEQNYSNKESLVLEMEDTVLMSDTQRYKQLGNAVTVNVIEAIINGWFK